jgi:hypothetical protein
MNDFRAACHRDLRQPPQYPPARAVRFIAKPWNPLALLRETQRGSEE